jgi:hypothetical protein
VVKKLARENEKSRAALPPDDRHHRKGKLTEVAAVSTR